MCPADWETFGLACVEALACDVPVLARPTGVHAEALRGIAGTQCAEWDLATWLRGASAAPARRRSAHRRARPRAAVLGRRARRARRDRVALAAVGWTAAASIHSERGTGGVLAGCPFAMTGLKQRLPRRRASGSSRPGAGGLKSRLPGFLAGRRKGKGIGPAWGKRKGKGPPWGKRAAAPAAGDSTAAAHVVDPGGSASFRDRGKLRRRLQYLRRARELAFRDVGGLIFDMRRFGRDRPDLVEAKLTALTAVDSELRALERVLDDRRPIHELREPGLSSCPRCGALHASEDHFCPRCGLQIGGPQAMGEVGGAIAAPPQAPAAPVEPPTAATMIAPTPPAPPAPPAQAAPAYPADAQQTEIYRPPDAP